MARGTSAAHSDRGVEMGWQGKIIQGEELGGLDQSGGCEHGERCADLNIFRQWKEQGM